MSNLVELEQSELDAVAGGQINDPWGPPVPPPGFGPGHFPKL